MKKVVLYIIILVSILSCSKQDVIDTGISSPYFDGNMMEYLRSDDYNWKLTVEMIEHAGLTDLFEGKDTDYPEITFFGLKSHSIQRWLWARNVEKVSETDPAECRYHLMRMLVKGKFLKNDIDYRNMEYLIIDPKQDGGTVLETLGGGKIKAYRETSDYNGVPELGPEYLRLWSMDWNMPVPMATPDIQPKNGVVHALNYGFTVGNI